MQRSAALFVLFAFFLLSSADHLRGDEDALPPEIGFNRDIRPILSSKCFACHGPDAGKRAAKLRFDVESIAKAERRGGAAIVPGDPDRSVALQRIQHADPDERMPPADSGKELSATEVALIRRWIEQGAGYQAHWSFVPPARPALPDVKDTAWPTNAIDRFVLARLEAEGLEPSGAADRATLLRRVTFDITGLPPGSADTRAFLTDESPDAYARLVERLLSSHHHGERLAIYWLDLVRYADTVGYHGDQDHAATPYRDWVIHAFNQNMRFDRFTAEQLAGDLIPGGGVDQKIASAYNRLLQTTHEGGAQAREYLAKYSADRVRNLSAVWMGATLGCAECHNHKYDPYTQRDFYSVAAFFADIDEEKMFGAPNSIPTKRPPEIQVVSPLDRALAARLAEQIETLRQRQEASKTAVAGAAPDAEKGAADRLSKLELRIDRLDKRRRALLARKSPVMVSVSIKPRTVRVLERGDWLDDDGEVVEPGVPGFLRKLDVEGRRATRLDLARWLTSGDHPQTARVLVNRLWYLFFGAGLSRVLEDTGSQGEWPTHPELLDWLAVELAESGWNIRHVIRLIVSSSAYRQSSIGSSRLRRDDPQNRLLARQGRSRLPAEMIRDNALAISGLLFEEAVGGRSRPYQPAGYYGNLNFPARKYRADADENQYRRGVYVHWQRQFLHPMMRALDAATREECTAHRPQSNTPSAALTLLNDPTFVEAARAFGALILRSGQTVDDRILWAWKRALARRPNAREVAAVAGLFRAELELFRADTAAARALLGVGLAPVPEQLDPAELAAWTSVARAVLNLDETISRN